MRWRSDENGWEAEMTFELERLVRKNIRRLKPYSSARSEFEGSAEVFLDANENSFGSPAGDGFNRYPDPLQKQLKARIAIIKQLDTSQIFVGNGSDEAIDILFRIFCEPGNDEVITCPPTYGMYRVSAEINDVSVREVPLTTQFGLNVEGIKSAISERTKILFICSPNNPTGNLMEREAIIELAAFFDGIVVVDEAYIDFARQPSFSTELEHFPNIVVLQTFSKAWGMAGLRVGLAFASAYIVELMNRIKPPYNVSGIAQRAVIDAMREADSVNRWVAEILVQRERLAGGLAEFGFVEEVYQSDANFLLVRVSSARSVYRHLVGENIVVRDRGMVRLCDECLRITVGTPSENDRLIEALSSFEGK